MHEKNIKFANLPEILFRYRIHDKSMTKLRSGKPKDQSVQIKINNIKKYISLTGREEEALKNKYNGINNSWDLRIIYLIFNKLVKAYSEKEKLSAEQKEIIARAYKMGYFVKNNLFELVKSKLR